MYLCRSDLGGSKLIINEESSHNAFFFKKKNPPVLRAKMDEILVTSEF